MRKTNDVEVTSRHSLRLGEYHRRETVTPKQIAKQQPYSTVIFACSTTLR